jgi:N-methylhydantoinase B
MDSDGCGGPRVKIHVTLTVEGDSLTADFTGTDPQVSGAINSTLSFAASRVGLCVRAVMQEQISNNSGMFRPLRVYSPRGTMVNVEMPGASSMRGVTGFRVVDALFGALAQMLPDRVLAAGEGGNTLVIIGSKRPDRSRYVFYELLCGTWGARPDRDGCDGISNPANVASNIPVEQAESEYPVRVERYGLVRDTGGAGRFRGGMAVEREWRHLGQSTGSLTIRSDRRAHLPYGLFGGGSGAPSISVLRHADREEVLPVMISTSIQPGEVIYHQQAGGGGFGDPRERDPLAVAADVRDDRVSIESAREHYGVVLAPGTLEVDAAATAALRSAQRQKPKP